MQSFTAYRVHNDDGISAAFDTLTLDDLTPGDVVIKAAYSGINYKDALAVTGAGRIMKRFPLVAGVDVSGVVVRSDSAAFKEGDPVLITGCGLGEEIDGGYAEYVRAPAESVVALPPSLSLWDVMCVGTAGFTAALAVTRMERNGQQPDMGPIVVTGATGGVGSLAISMLTRAGYEVTAVSGKVDQAGDYLRGLGASTIIDRREIDFGRRPLEKALWAGAVDNVGGEMLTWLTRTTDWFGNIASIGLAGGYQLETTVMPFILRGINLLGINSVRTPRPERLAVWERIATDLTPDLATIGTRTEPLSALPGLFQAYLDADVTGRTVVKIAENA